MNKKCNRQSFTISTTGFKKLTTALYCKNETEYRAVAVGPPAFGSSENPILTRGADYVHHCNKVREVARRRTVMFDDGGMNDETSATI